MSRPRLLDLFCGAGGAAMGYHRAGFEVVGVDIKPQPRYPFAFIQGDALAPPVRVEDFDVIHASPPCQAYSRASSLGIARNGGYPDHPDLIGRTREFLRGHAYVIENVPGAPLVNPIRLCGARFPGVRVYRHRDFESSLPLVEIPHVPHRDSTPSAGNGISPKGFISVAGTGGVRGMKAPEILDYWQRAMGTPWMKTRAEIKESIPPAYTEFIGEQLMDHLRGIT